MKRAYKTEIKPTKEQIQKINQSIGICRWLYNSYMAKNKELYELYKQDLITKEKAFMSANDFDKYINNEVKVYVSVVIDVHMPIVSKNTNEGIGIDLGLKDFAICSNGEKYKNINKTEKIRKIEKKLKREQKKLSKKYENLKKKGGTANKSNIKKQIVKVQKLHHKLDNIRTDYVNKTISNIINQKPKFITIEDLNVKGMMKNKHLSKSVANEKFYEFRSKLTNKCNVLGIELRIVDRFYPSSKLCHSCGSIKKDLKLKDRIYKCNCGYIEDRDYNASLNLRDCLTYKIAQ
ncbi:MAG: RNA-guided endonuclease TnpB family protein [Clostridium sp.]